MYSRGLAEFVKKEIMEICPKDVVDIRIPRKDDDNKVIGLLIIELKFEKKVMEPHNIWKRKHPTINEKRYFMGKVPPVWAPQKVL